MRREEAGRLYVDIFRVGVMIAVPCSTGTAMVPGSVVLLLFSNGVSEDIRS